MRESHIGEEDRNQGDHQLLEDEVRTWGDPLGYIGF